MRLSEVDLGIIGTKVVQFAIKDLEPAEKAEFLGAALEIISGRSAQFNCLKAESDRSQFWSMNTWLLRDSQMNTGKDF